MKPALPNKSENSVKSTTPVIPVIELGSKIPTPKPDKSILVPTYEIEADQVVNLPSDKKCDICHQTFKYFQTLLQHKSQKHGIKTTFCCDKCNFKSHLPKDLRLHRQSVHQITKRKASNSELTKKIPRIEASEMYETTEIDIQEDSIVNETVISENSNPTISLLSIKPKNENVTWFCDICDIQVKEDKIEHLKEHFKKKFCDICQVSFNYYHTLLTHMLESHQIREYFFPY